MTTRSPYRSHLLPFWLRETIALIGLGVFMFVCLWVFPIVLQGMQ